MDLNTYIFLNFKHYDDDAKLHSIHFKFSMLLNSPVSKAGVQNVTKCKQTYAINIFKFTAWCWISYFPTATADNNHVTPSSSSEACCH